MSKDLKDLTEGIKKRPPHKFKSLPPLTKDENLVEYIIATAGNLDLRSTAKKYEKTNKEVLEIISYLGYY